MVASGHGQGTGSPAPLVALSKAILSQKWGEASAISERLNWAVRAMFPGGDLSKFMDYSSPLGHVRFREAGLFEPGPCRPPYLEAPADYVEGSRVCGQRWAELQREYTKSS